METERDLSPRTVQASSVETTHLVLPQDTNALGNIFGGTLVSWIDLAAATAATRHSHRVCVTASIDGLDFIHPIRLGDIVILKAAVNYVGSSSLEVGVRVETEDPLSGRRIYAATSYLTFVALGEDHRPARVPPLVCETNEEKRRNQQARQRREERLKTRRNKS